VLFGVFAALSFFLGESSGRMRQGDGKATSRPLCWHLGRRTRYPRWYSFSVDGTGTLEMTTRADLTKEICQAVGLPLKESDVVVCTILDSIVRALRAGDKVEIRGFGTFNTRSRGGRIHAMQRLVRLSRCHRRVFPSSKRVRNSANW